MREVGVPIDAGGHERVCDLHAERGRAAEEQEQLAVHPTGDGWARKQLIGHTLGVRSFGYALAGIAFLIRTQRNFRIHLLVAAGAVVAAVALGVSSVEWAVLWATIALVIMMEGLNTGIELAIDLASPERRPEAEAAKDIAAGMVLVAAIASVGVGLFIFGPRLASLFRP